MGAPKGIKAREEPLRSDVTRASGLDASAGKAIQFNRLGGP